MKIRFSLVFICVFLSLGLIQCSKPNNPAPGNGNTNDSINYPTPDPDPYPDRVIASVYTRTLDENGQPLSNVEINGYSSRSTDINGVYDLRSSVFNDRNAGYISFRKEGYFDHFKQIMLSVSNDLEVQLIKKKNIGRFNSETIAVIDLPDSKGSIVISPQSIIDTSTKQLYAGTVNAITHYYDATHPSFPEQMPSSLRYITPDQEGVLQSFGITRLELTDANEKTLKIAPEKTVSISSFIPVSLQSKAPPSIPVWTWVAKTLWQQTGTAIREGNYYKTTVPWKSYYGLWNFAVPAPAIRLYVEFKSSPGQGIYENLRVSFTDTDGNSFMEPAYINGGGLVTTKIPANKPMVMAIKTQCGDVVYSQNIGPFSSDATISNIILNSPSSLCSFSGSVIDCNGKAVTGGYVSLLMEGREYRVEINNTGRFYNMFPRCSNKMIKVIVTPYDGNGKKGTPVEVTILDTNLQMERLIVC